MAKKPPDKPEPKTLIMGDPLAPLTPPRGPGNPAFVPGNTLRPAGVGFQKGVSGNPNGMIVSQLKKEFRELGAKDTPKIYAKLMQVIDECDDPDIVLKALNIWLDRMHGRVTPAAPDEEGPEGFRNVDPSELNQSELRNNMKMMLETMGRLMMAQGTTIEGKK